MNFCIYSISVPYCFFLRYFATFLYPRPFPLPQSFFYPTLFTFFPLCFFFSPPAFLLSLLRFFLSILLFSSPLAPPLLLLLHLFHLLFLRVTRHSPFNNVWVLGRPPFTLHLREGRRRVEAEEGEERELLTRLEGIHEALSLPPFPISSCGVAFGFPTISRWLTCTWPLGESGVTHQWWCGEALLLLLLKQDRSILTVVVLIHRY